MTQPIEFIRDKKLVHVAVGLLYDYKGRILMGKRPLGKQHGGCFEWPGGKVEPGETGSKALVREWWEGLVEDIEIVARVGAAMLDSHCMCVLELFAVRSRMNRREAQEHSELCWVRPSDAEGFDTTAPLVCTPGTVVLMPLVRNYHHATRRPFGRTLSW